MRLRDVKSGPARVIIGTTWVRRSDRARCVIMGKRSALGLVAALLVGAGGSVEAAESVVVIRAEGQVSVRGPSEEGYRRVKTRDRIGHGSRLRTGADGKVELQFADRTRSKVMPNSEVMVRAPGGDAKNPNGVVVFFGRLWSSVVKSVSGKETFEVRGANAVAGVRGTEFEVGVADDGASRVVVDEGLVDVEGDVDGQTVPVGPGYLVDADAQGRLQERRKTPKRLDWDGWFSAHARALERRGRVIAKDLHGRLDRRRAQVQRLVGEQRRLRASIERLEAQRRAGAPVNAQLKDNLQRLERVTERLEDMQRRVQAGFGIFGLWGRRVESGRLRESPQMRTLVEDIKRVEKDFADMFEEGTDLSPESLEEMMDDMKRGPTLKPKKKAKDELF